MKRHLEPRRGARLAVDYSAKSIDVKRSSMAVDSLLATTVDYAAKSIDVKRVNIQPAQDVTDR